MLKNPALKILMAAILFLFGLTACARSEKSLGETNSANNARPENTAAPSTPTPAAATTFTSVYTDMKNDCKTLEDPPGAEEGGDPAGECKGYGGYRIFISHSASAANYSVENLKNPDESIDMGTDYSGYGEKGEKVEWRMANDKPFAVIMRIGKYKELDDPAYQYTDKNRIGSTLVVKGLKGWEHIDFKVDGATPNANEKAREMADQNYSKK